MECSLDGMRFEWCCWRRSKDPEFLKQKEHGRQQDDHESLHPSMRIPEPIDQQRQRQKIDRGLAVMEKDLGSNEFCHGASFTLADIAAGFALGYLDHVLPDVDWRKSCPGLKGLAGRLAARASFVETRPTV